MGESLSLRRALYLGVAVLTVVASGQSFAQSASPDSSSLTFNDWTVNCAFPAAAAPASEKPAGEKAAAAKADTKATETKGAAKADSKAADAAAKETALCEMKQQFMDRNTRQLFAQLAIGRATAGGTMKIVFQAPAGIYLPPGFTLSVGASATVKGVFTRCVNNVCSAEADAKPELIEQAKTADKMSISFSDGTARTVTLPVSPNGFAKAFAALERGPK